MDIQWFPGHMAKTEKLIRENIKLADVIIELLDARIPNSSCNPLFKKYTKDKKKLVLLNKADLGDSQTNQEWFEYFTKSGQEVILTDSLRGKGIKQVAARLGEISRELLERYKKRGRINYDIKVMVIGIPNVGKSAFINAFVNKKAAKTGNKPGVTRNKQWIRLRQGFSLLDTPGTLWPKIEDRETALRLALIGTIKDQILDVYLLALELLKILQKRYPVTLEQRYGLTELQELDERLIFEQIARRRGALSKGGEIDHERCANMLLDEFRSGKLGSISLEVPFIEQ